eukprot:6173747-Pleurochrysis_carterae.AAC.2
MRFCLLFAAVAIARCQTGAIPFYEDPLANISYTEKDACAPYQGLLIDPDQELGVCYPCSYYAVSRPVGDEFIGGPGATAPYIILTATSAWTRKYASATLASELRLHD